MSGSGLVAKKVTVGTTRTTGPNVVVPTGMAVRVKAPNGNTGVLFVGEVGVVDNDAGTGEGYDLRANEDALFWVQNMNQIGLIASAASQVAKLSVEK